MVLGLKKIPNIWRDVSNLSSVSAVKDVGPRCSGCWPAGSGPAGLWVSVWQQQLLCSYRRPWKTPEKSVEVLYAASPGCCDLLSSVPFRTARMSPVLSFSVLYMQLCLRELHHAIHALMVVSHSRCQLLQRATARTAADAGGVWDTPATALGLPAGCLHVSMHVYSWRGSQLVLFQPMCPCLSSSIIKTSESPWLRRFFGTVGWQIPWGEHRCSPRSTSSPSSSGLSQEQDKSNPRGPCARYLGWFWGVIWRPDSGVGAGRGCRLQACSFEISTSGLSVCMPPAWGCEGVQASGTLAGDFGHWGMQAVKDVAQGDTGTEGHGCWGTWCRGMFCCETRAPRGTVTGRHEHWGKWHRGMLHWWTRALKADTEAEGSDGRGGRGRETRSPSTRSASRPSRQAARHGGAEQSRAEQAHGGQHGGGHGGGHVSRAAPLATAAAAPQRGTARPARRPHRVLQLRHQRGGVPRPAGARGRAGSGLRSSRSGARPHAWTPVSCRTFPRWSWRWRTAAWRSPWWGSPSRRPWCPRGRCARRWRCSRPSAGGCAAPTAGGWRWAPSLAGVLSHLSHGFRASPAWEAFLRAASCRGCSAGRADSESFSLRWALCPLFLFPFAPLQDLSCVPSALGWVLSPVSLCRRSCKEISFIPQTIRIQGSSFFLQKSRSRGSMALKPKS